MGLLPIFHNDPAVLQVLEFVSKKRLLNQDAFLLHEPSTPALQIVRHFFHSKIDIKSQPRAASPQESFLDPEEYCCITTDTTVADLIQRKELGPQGTFFVDGPVLRAAQLGKVLILDGLHRAERNLLPVLNNLIENREINLDDGRFLLPQHKYEKIPPAKRTEMVPVHPNFQIIALGIPVPPFIGNFSIFIKNFHLQPIGSPFAKVKDYLNATNVLDPRIFFPKKFCRQLRFQCLRVQTFQHIRDVTLQLTPDRGFSNQLFEIRQIFTELQKNQTLNSAALPSLSDQAIIDLCVLSGQGLLTSDGLQFWMHIVYPYFLLKNKDLVSSLQANCKGVFAQDILYSSPRKFQVVRESQHSKTLRSARLQNRDTSLIVPCGEFAHNLGQPTQSAIGFEDLLEQMSLSHYLGRDICLMGPPGCGKSLLAQQFALRFGYSVVTVPVHRENTAQSLLQVRTIEKNSTRHLHSGLVAGLLNGSLIVLDGLHRLSFGVLGGLKAVFERYVVLPDGTKLLSTRAFEDLKSQSGCSAPQLAQQRIFCIHPAARVICLAEEPTFENPWLEEFFSTFHFYFPGRVDLTAHLPAMLTRHLTQVVNGVGQKFNQLNVSSGNEKPNGEETVSLLVKLCAEVQKINVDPLAHFDFHLSLRLMLKLAVFCYLYPQQQYEWISRLVVLDFMPPTHKMHFQKIFEKLKIRPNPIKAEGVRIEKAHGQLRIGDTVTFVNPRCEFPELVPHPKFFEIPMHTLLLQDLLRAFLLDESLLLIGNQGTGKNLLTDQLLHLLELPRDYIQLNRDITLRQITTTQNFSFSGLASDTNQSSGDRSFLQLKMNAFSRAMSFGRAVVLDEADKCPEDVLQAIRGLIVDGVLWLDEEVWVDPRKAPGFKLDQSDIRVNVVQPGFRVIFLGNRPGWPFLGNDFMKVMGDIFCCFPVQNPDPESEFALLCSYAPTVPESVVKQLITSFSELRQLHLEGEIAYPYSMRELIQLTRHLEKFPNDSFSKTFANVFDFDSFNSETYRTVSQIFSKNGFPLGAILAATEGTDLRPQGHLPHLEYGGGFSISPLDYFKGPVDRDMVHSVPVVQTSEQVDFQPLFDIKSSRVERFWEQILTFTLPIGSNSRTIGCVAIELDGVSVGVFLTDHLEVFFVLFSEIQFRICRFDLALKIGYSQSTKAHVTFPTSAHLFADAKASKVFVFHPDTGSLASLWLTHEPHFLHLRVLPLTGVIPHGSHNLVWHVAYSPDAGTATLAPLGHPTFFLFDTKDASFARFYLEPKCRVASVSHMLKPTNFLLQDVDGNFWDLDWNESFAVLKGLKSHFVTTIEKNPTQAAPVFASPPISTQFSPQVDVDEIPISKSHQYFQVLYGGKFSSKSFATLCFGYDMSSFSNFSCHLGFFPRTPNPSQAITGETEQATWQSLWLTHSRFIVTACSQPGQLFLEKVSLPDHGIATIPLPTTKPAQRAFPQVASLCELSLGQLVVTQDDGVVRLFELRAEHLQKQESEWRLSLLRRESGQKSEGQLGSGSQSDRSQEQTDSGEGGAEGTGGVGGVGQSGEGGQSTDESSEGAYQEILKDLQFEMDSTSPTNRNTSQLVEEDETEIEDLLRRAKEKALQILKQPEEEKERKRNFIGLSYEQYSQLRESVQTHVYQLVSILQSVEAKEKERVWLKNSPVGEIDDSKIVNLVVGEKNVFKKRGYRPHLYGGLQKKPKRIRFLIDCSRSMSKFNSNDRRLDRTMALVVMILESFGSVAELLNFEKFEISIAGHSGDSSCIRLVDPGNFPKSAEERLRVLDIDHLKTLFERKSDRIFFSYFARIYYESMYCSSGDNTLSGIIHSLKFLTKNAEQADDFFLFVLSDANFQTYGITPTVLAKLLQEDSLKSMLEDTSLLLSSFLFWISQGAVVNDIVNHLDSPLKPKTF